MKLLSVLFKILGTVWMILFFIVFVFGIVAMFIAEPTLYLGFKRVTSFLSPFNISGWITNVVCTLPGIGLYKAGEYFEKLADQALLAEIAVEDKDRDVRSAAVKNLTDQALLAKIAVEDENSFVRWDAVGSLTDQALLAKIAVEDENSFVRWNAVVRLTDQAVLAKIAVEDESPDVRAWAAKKLVK